MHTFGIQHARDVQILLGHIEGSVQVLHRIVLGQLAVVDEIRSVTMDQGAERQTILQNKRNIDGQTNDPLESHDAYAP